VTPVDRRSFLRGSTLAAGFLSGPTTADALSPAALGQASDAPGPTSLLVFNVRTYGALADGTTPDTNAFVSAIEAATTAGGGVVYVAPGSYLVGSIRLLSNVTLYLEAGATLLATTNRSAYTGGCLIHAEDATSVGLAGRGVVEGNGPDFWRRKNDGTWTSQEWRPTELVRFTRCPNLLIEDVTLRNSPNWTLHAIDCDRVEIRGISIVNGLGADDGPNTDGVMIDGCSKTTISDCFIQSGDDCVVLKCMQSRAQMCRDITVTNCVLVTSESALKIGSDTLGQFYNITFSNCAIRDAGCGIGLWMRDGGLVDGWRISNIAMTLTGGGQPIFFWSHRRTDQTPWGTVRNVSISDLTATADGGILLSGVPERWLENIWLRDIRIHMRGATSDKLHASPPFPFPIWDHRRSPYDIFCRYVRNLRLENVHFTRNEPERPEWGGAIRCHDVAGLDIDGFVGRQARGSDEPIVRLRNARDVFIRNCRAPEGAGIFLGLEGGVDRVTMMGNDLGRAKRAVQALDPDRLPQMLYEFGNRTPPP
jgi:hypothetical protein